MKHWKAVSTSKINPASISDNNSHLNNHYSHLELRKVAEEKNPTISTRTIKTNLTGYCY